MIFYAVVRFASELGTDDGPFIPELVMELEHGVLLFKAPFLLGMGSVDVGCVPLFALFAIAPFDSEFFL